MSTGARAGGALLRQAAVWFGLAAIVGASWIALARMNAGMAGMAGPDMGMAARPLAAELAAAFVMWSVMMAAMMGPTVVRTLAVFAELSRRRAAAAAAPEVSAPFFVLGYLAAWIGFAAFAALAQTALARAALLTPMSQSASVALSAGILLAAGLFQFTPLKESCLAKCRAPLGFFLAEWRDGARGALVMGLRHGQYCVGCCWALMAVMFVVGAMNLLWMAALTMVILAEKLLPAAWRFRHATGVALIAWGFLTAAKLLP